MIHELDLKYDVAESILYYKDLEKNFSKLKWIYFDDHNNLSVIEAKNSMNKTAGWGLQTIYDDPDFPYHCDLDPHDEGPEYFKDTKMVFGFFYRIRNLFPEIFRSFLFVFQPGEYIGKWIPTLPEHDKIFIPIDCNNQTIIVSHGNETTTKILEPGKILLLETKNYAEFRNDGDTASIFITFNVPVAYREYCRNLKGQI